MRLQRVGHSDFHLHFFSSLLASGTHLPTSQSTAVLGVQDQALIYMGSQHNLWAHGHSVAGLPEAPPTTHTPSPPVASRLGPTHQLAQDPAPFTSSPMPGSGFPRLCSHQAGWHQSWDDCPQAPWTAILGCSHTHHQASDRPRTL